MDSAIVWINKFRFDVSLFILTLLYLILPQVIFVGGWLRQPWRTLIILLLFFSIAAALGPVMQLAAQGKPQPKPSLGTLLGLCIVSGGLILISGIGGYGFQHFDWDKHNQILQDLVTESWPVSYPFYGGTVGLVYYIAYYLPASMVGQWSGWIPANIVLMLWSWIGLTLALIWFTILVGRRPLWIAALMLLLFSGLDILGSWLTHSPLGAFWPEESFPLEWSYWMNHDDWSGKWQYSNSIKLIFTLPNQILAGWLATSLVIYSVFRRSGEEILILIWGSTALWSPFITLGLSPFVIGGAFVAKKSPMKRYLSHFITLPNLTGLALLVVAAAFYASKLAPFPAIEIPELRNHFVLWEFTGWQARLRWAAMLLIFWLIELALWVWTIHTAKIVVSRSDRVLVTLSIGALLVLPFWAFGDANDLHRNTAIPALFVLAVLSARAVFQLYDQWRDNANLSRHEITALLTACLLMILAALNPIQDVALHIIRTMEPEKRHSLEMDEGNSIVDRFRARPERLFQYIANTDTFFFDSLSRPLALPNGEPASRVIKFGDSLMLIDHDIETRYTKAGDPIHLSFTFEAISPMTDSLGLAVRATSRDGAVLWEQQSWPSGRPTKNWQPFHRYYDSRTMTIPPETPVGIYRIDAYFFNPKNDDKLTATDLNSGQVLGDVIAIDYFEVSAREENIIAPLTFPVQFGDSIALMSSTIKETLLAPGDTLTVNLIWQALSQPDEDFTLSLQILDAEGRLAAQKDIAPLQGFIPTHLWQQSFRAEEQITLQLSSDVEPGRYSVWLVLYDLTSGVRLPAVHAGSVQGDAYAIGPIDIQR